MEGLTFAILAACLLSGGFVLGGIFGASVYHFAKKQVEAGAKAVSGAADRAAKTINVETSKL